MPLPPVPDGSAPPVLPADPAGLVEPAAPATPEPVDPALPELPLPTSPVQPARPANSKTERLLRMACICISSCPSVEHSDPGWVRAARNKNHGRYVGIRDRCLDALTAQNQLTRDERPRQISIALKREEARTV